MSMETVKRLAALAGDDVEHTLQSDMDFLERFAAIVAIEAGDVMRERSAALCDRFADREMHPAECAGAISSIPGVTLADLKGAE